MEVLFINTVVEYLIKIDTLQHSLHIVWHLGSLSLVYQHWEVIANRGTSLVVQCIRLHTSTAGDTVSPLVRELRSHRLCDMAKEKKYIANRKILSQGHENYLLFQGPSWAMNGMLCVCHI